MRPHRVPPTRSDPETVAGLFQRAWRAGRTISEIRDLARAEFGKAGTDAMDTMAATVQEAVAGCIAEGRDADQLLRKVFPPDGAQTLLERLARDDSLPPAFRSLAAIAAEL